MYNQPFLIPGYYSNIGTRMIPSIIGRNIANNSIRGNLFSRIANTFGAIKNFNWSGLINNTSKTLGIINQTIPIVKQAGPMINNVRSMVKIASIFKDETDNKYIKKNKSSNNLNTNNNNKKDDFDNYYNNSPTFFVK